MVQGLGVILQQWAEMDIFYYALPFLLIFSLVFAIMQKIKIMGGADENTAWEHNRGVSAIIAASVGLLALQYDYVPVFFSIIFPKLGMGLAVLLVALIFMGLFVDFNKHGGAALIFFAIGGIIGGVVLLSSFSDYTWWTGGFWQENMSAIIAGIIILVFVGVVVGSGKTHGANDQNWLFKGLLPANPRTP